MKKIHILITAILVFTTVSCKKNFIDLAPLDSLSPANFFQTEAQLRQAVITAYVPLRDLYTYDFYMCEMRTDNTHYQPYPSNVGTAYVQRENISDYVDDPNNGVTNAEYFACYSGISRANIVIGSIPNVTSLAAAAKNDIDGQAKFLRAFYYFKLVKLYGGVPLYLKEVAKAEDAFLPRSTPDQVYAQIIADASDAVKELSAPASFPQSGQATKGSATMLLAEVYMTQKKYADAETLLSSLPAMGYALNANYADAFLTTNKNSKESLFEVQYLQGTASGSQPSNFIYQFLPRTASPTAITGTVINTASIGGWNTPTQDLIDSYEPGDKRLDASVGIAEGVYVGDLMTLSANKSIVGYVAPAGKIGVPYPKKYLHLPHAAANNTNDDWPVYRYSDALLLLAEAQNEQGKSPLTALNAVRTRAGLAGVTVTDQASLRTAILHERRIELAFENHRWDDLLRTGTAIPVMTAYAIKAKATYTNLPTNAFNITTDKLLYPIPQSERGINPQLTQNPGYF